MRVTTLLTLVSAAAIGLAACAPEPAAPSDVTKVDVPPLGVTCSWTPSGGVVIPTGTTQTFTSSFGCSGYSVTITPSSTDFGFTSDCSLKSVTTPTAGIFKIKACEDGQEGTVTIRLNGNTVQTIFLESDPV